MRWLLRFLLSEPDRRAIESDLAELYELRRRRDGARAARRSAKCLLRAADNRRPRGLVALPAPGDEGAGPGLALSSVATGDELIAEALATPRYLSVLIGMFALTAVMLSVIGIYGVMAYFVQQHTRDIGIRLALGGDAARVRRMVVLHGLRLVVIGVTIGIGVALVTSRLMVTILFEVSPTDPRTIMGWWQRSWPSRS